MKKQTWKIGWKVVRKVYLIGRDVGDHTYESSHVGILEYSTKQITKPNKGCGPLCVFTNYYDALLFVKHEPVRLEVKPCIYIPDDKHINVWLADDRYRKSVEDLPRGKALAKRVLLVKQVKPCLKG